MGGRIDGLLIAGGVSHDIDVARLELLKLLLPLDGARVRVSADYEDVAGLDRSAFLITYTCNLAPSPAGQAALERFMARGGRWLALHATNALLDWTPQGVASLGEGSAFIELLGSEFRAHPAIGPLTVEVVDEAHPLVAGLAPFEVTDELYLSRFARPTRVLLATRFSGAAPGFVDSDWSEGELRPILYVTEADAGEILYFNLGHARGHYDAPHRAAYLPTQDRGPWDHPSYREVLSRCLAWAVTGEPSLARAVEAGRML